MSFQTSQGVRFFSFDIFADEIHHAVFTRNGGVSLAPWGTLNVGGTVGDERASVIENRIRSFRAMGRDPDSMFDVWQIHSADVVVARAPNDVNVPDIKADGIITNNPDVTLFMRFADCVPILLHDPIKNVVGIVHSGWQGTVKRAVGATVESMKVNFACNPADIHAGIGPSIGPDHYEVGADVIAQANQTFGGRAKEVLVQNNSSIHFDLWKANKIILEEAGVTEIQIAEVCTACHTEDWYSHRAEKGKTGRFGALIALKNRKS